MDFNLPQQPIQPNKPKFPHLILGIIFVIAALGAAVAGIYYWQTVRNLPSSAYEPVIHHDPTANWKTYTNEKYGISVRYPPYNNDFNPASNIGVDLLDDTEPENGPGAFWIGLSQKIWHQRLDNKGRYKIGDECTTDGEHELQCKVLSLNPYGILTKESWASPVNFQYYLSILTDKFQLTIGPLPRDLSSESLNQILSTFKFVDILSADDTIKKLADEIEKGDLNQVVNRYFDPELETDRGLITSLSSEQRIKLANYFRNAKLETENDKRKIYAGVFEGETKKFAISKNASGEWRIILW